MKLHHITNACDIHLIGADTQPAHNQQITSGFRLLGIMCAPVHQIAIHSALVFCPLLLYVNQRPLPGAVCKVLYTRKHERLSIHYIMRAQVTPSGRFSSSMVTA